MKQFFILLSLLFIFQKTTAQETWKNYTPAGKYFHTMTVDAQGNKWFLTSDGISKFDGVHWTNYNSRNSILPQANYYGFTIDKFGNKWVVTDNDVFKLNGGVWTQYSHPLFYNNSLYGFPPAIVTDTNGYLYFGTYGEGLYIFDYLGNNWFQCTTNNSALPSNTINAMNIDKNGLLWLGTIYGLTVFDGTQFNTYDTSNSPLYDNTINVISVDAHNKKWIASNNGLVAFDDTTWTTYPSNVSAGIFSISIDAQDDKWIIIGYNGITKLHDTTWTFYNQPNGLPNNIININTQIPGEVWGMTFYGDMAKFDGANWTVYLRDSFNTLKNGSIANIAIDQLGNKWIVDKYGLLSKFDGSTWTNYFQIDSFIIAQNLASIAVDKNNNLWLRTYYDGILMFDGTHITKIQDNSSLIYSFAVDPAGKIWWYNNNKFYNYDGTTTNYYTTQGIQGSTFMYAIDNQNNIWAYFYNDSSFYKFDGTTWINYNSLTNGFILDDFTTIAIDHQNIVWVGTNNKGLFSFDGNTWTNYNTLNSNLPGNAIRAIAIDASNRKWIGTDSGLCKFDGINWKTYATNNTNHGLVSNDISCIAFDPQGNRWIGTGDYGISVLSGFPLAIQEIPSNINANDCYPNPAQNKLYFHHITAEESLSVFDLSGKLLLQKQLSPACNNIDVSSLAQGMYLYKHGNTTGKFVKE